MARLQIVVTVTGFKSALAAVEHVKNIIRASGPDVVDYVAAQTRHLVQARYTDGFYQGLAPLTLAKRRMGKRAGVRPPIQTFSSVKPLSRSGELARAVERVPARAIARGAEARVRISPKARGSDGRRLSAIAPILEYGATVIVPLTGPAARYLAVLRKGTAGPPSGTPSPSSPPDKDRIEGAIAAVVPARPVWRPAGRAAHRKVAHWTIQVLLARLSSGAPIGYEPGATIPIVPLRPLRP